MAYILLVHLIYVLNSSSLDAKDSSFIFGTNGCWSYYMILKAFSTVGTPDYIAPEVLLKKGYGMECDWLVSFVAN